MAFDRHTYKVYHCRRHRLLVLLTVGRYFLFPSLPLLTLPLLNPSLSFLSPFFPPSPSHPFSLLRMSCSLPCLLSFPLPPSLIPLSLSLNPPRGSEERCKLPSGSGLRLAAKRFWCFFRLESAHLLSVAK